MKTKIFLAFVAVLFSVAVKAQAPVIIEGPTTIADGYEVTYTVQGAGMASITWNVSPNLEMISPQGWPVLTVRKKEPYTTGPAWVEAIVYKHYVGIKDDIMLINARSAEASDEASTE